MKLNNTKTSVINDLEEYLSTRFKLFKYIAIDKFGSEVAETVADIILIVVFLLTLIFFSFFLAFLAANLLSSYWEGFGCVCLMYVLITLAIHIFKGKLERILVNVFIKKLFSDDEQNQR